ncbi:unnamed protein product [Pichia kudriavzevii]
MMASVVYLLDSKARPLIHRDYKGDVPISLVEEFPLLLLKKTTTDTISTNLSAIDDVPPILYHQGYCFTYILHNDIYVLAISHSDVNVFDILVFLNNLIGVFTSHFKQLNEVAIKDNYSVVYELLDEMMDFGIPQLTDDKVLKEYITQQSLTFERLIEKVSNSATSTHKKIKQPRQIRREQRCFANDIDQCRFLETRGAPV